MSEVEQPQQNQSPEVETIAPEPDTGEAVEPDTDEADDGS